MRLPVVFIRRRFFTGSARANGHGRAAAAMDKEEILSDAGRKTHSPSGISVACAPDVRVIFAAWLVLALLLLGLGRWTVAETREPATRHLSSLR
jgi:hypothetical protein